MWGVLKNAAALATESAQNLTSQATQLLEKLDGEMKREDDEEGNEDESEEIDNGEGSSNDVEVEQAREQLSMDGETFFVTPTKKKKSKAILEPTAASTEEPSVSAPSHNQKLDRGQEDLSGLLQEEVVGLKALITELTGKLDTQQSQHVLDLELKKNEVSAYIKDIETLTAQLNIATKKVEVLEKQTNILQLQSNLKEIKESRDAMKNDVTTTLTAFQSEFSSMIDALTPQKATGSQSDSEAQNSLVALQTENKLLHDQIEALNTKLTASHEVHEQLTKVVEALKASQSQYKEKSKQVMTSMKEKHSEEVSRLTALNAELTAANGSSCESLTNLSKECEQLKEQLSKTVQTELTLQGKIKSLEEKLVTESEMWQEQVEENNSEYESQIDSLRIELKKERSGKLDIENQLAASLEDKKSLESKLNSASDAMDSENRQQVEALQSQVTELTAQLDSVQSLKAAFDSISQDSQNTAETMKHQNEVILSLTNDNEELASSMKSLQTELDEWKKRGSGDVELVSELSTERSKLQETIASLQSELSAAKTNLNDSEVVNEQLSIELKKVQQLREETLQLLEEQMEEVTSSKSTQHASFLETKNSLKSTQSMLEAESVAHNRLKEAYELLLMSNESQGSQQKSLSDEANKLNIKISELSDQLSSQSEAHAAHLMELSREKQQLSEESGSLQKQLLLANEESMKLVEQMKALGEDHSKVDEQSKHEIDRLSESVGLLEQQLLVLKASSEVGVESSQQLSVVIAENQSLKEQIEVLSQGTESLKLELSGLQQSLQESMTDRQVLSDSSADVQLQLSTAKMQIQQLEDQVQASAVLVSTSTNEKSLLQSQLDEVLAANLLLTQQLKDIGDAKSVVDSELRAIVLSRDTLQEELHSLQQQLLVASKDSEVVDRLQSELNVTQHRLTASQQIVVELQSLKDSLVLQLEESVSESKRFSSSLSDANMRITKLQGESLIIKDEYQSKINVLEISLQDRVVENATLNEQLRELTHKTKNDSEELVQVKLKCDALLQQLSAITLDGSQAVKSVQSMLDAALEEVNVNKQEVDNLSEKTTLQAAEIIQLTAKLNRLTAIEEKFNAQTHQINEYIERAENAEETLNRMNDKKKKDLDNLKKQNEKIAALQREKVALEDTVNEMKWMAENNASANDEAYARKIVELNGFGEDWKAKYGKLEWELADLQEKYASSVGSTSAVNTPVVNSEIDKSEELISEIRQLKQRVVELEATIEDLQSTCAVRADEVERISVELASNLELMDKERSAHQQQLKQWQTSHSEELIKLNNELSSTTQTKSSLESKVVQLEGELKSLRKTISQSNVEAVAPLGQRQRIDRTASAGAADFSIVDLESGAGESIQSSNGTSSTQKNDTSTSSSAGTIAALCIESAASENLSEKKEVIGSHPLMYFIWNQFRKYAPWMLAVVGERPPRVSTTGLIVIAYVSVIQLLVIYLGYFRSCK